MSNYFIIVIELNDNRLAQTEIIAGQELMYEDNIFTNFTDFQFSPSINSNLLDSSTKLVIRVVDLELDEGEWLESETNARWGITHVIIRGE